MAHAGDDADVKATSFNDSFTNLLKSSKVQMFS